METVVTALAVALVGVMLVTLVYRSHAKALLKMVSEAHAERRAEVEKNAALRAELITAMHGAVRRLDGLTATARTINGRKPE